MKGKKYYSLKRILSKNAQYNMIYGERSNGKTYSVLLYGLTDFVRNGRQLAVVRRWREDFQGKRGATMFDSLVANGEVSKLTKGEWSGIRYHSGRWFLTRVETSDTGVETVVSDETPIAYAFSIASMEHDKSTSYPLIGNILFDEFITRKAYLPDEFVLFMNVISTIVRDRKDVRIFMCGNAVNKYCPYFGEMGLTHIKDMKQGDIEVYEYGDSGLRVAVEFSDSPNKGKGKDSDVYFAFNNPKLAMITGTGGVWEIAMYPHSPCKYAPKDILFTYFIQFDGEMVQCEVVLKDDSFFTFIHRKTSELKDPDNDVIFTEEYDPRPNHKRKLFPPKSKLEKKLVWFFLNDKVFYQDNEVGEIVSNYKNWCKTANLG